MATDKQCKSLQFGVNGQKYVIRDEDAHAKIDTLGGGVDKLTEKVNAIKQPDLTEYAKKSEIPNVDNLATKDEIPSIDGLATYRI